MTYRVVCDRAANALADAPAKEFLPHLVCSWTLDPASSSPVVRLGGARRRTEHRLAVRADRDPQPGPRHRARVVARQLIALADNM
jgi:hypothetical protein